jgi:hypothetical protein
VGFRPEDAVVSAGADEDGDGDGGDESNEGEEVFG